MALDPLLRHEPDRRLARKLLAVRVVFALLAVAMLFLVGLEAASGEVSVHAAVNNSGRSNAVLQDVSWSERPLVFALGVAFYGALYVMFAWGLCLVFEKYTRRWHGRPFFKRKYPY